MVWFSAFTIINRRIVIIYFSKSNKHDNFIKFVLKTKTRRSPWNYNYCTILSQLKIRTCVTSYEWI